MPPTKWLMDLFPDGAALSEELVLQDVVGRALQEIGAAFAAARSARMRVPVENTIALGLVRLHATESENGGEAVFQILLHAHTTKEQPRLEGGILT